MKAGTPKTPRRTGEVLITCVEHGHNAIARAQMTARFGGVAVSSTRRASASCTMGTEFAVKQAALKLLGGSEKSLTAVCIEDDRKLPRRTKWRVTR